MVKDTIVILSDGSMAKLTPKAINFIDDLKKFFADRGIPEEDIPLYLAELSRRNRRKRT